MVIDVFSRRVIGWQLSRNIDAQLCLDVRISMSRKGNPYDNAFAESFMKTLKSEEAYVNDYAPFKEAKENIEKFIEVVYNKKRLHSSLGYLPPAEYEQQVLMEELA
ncbi:transposase [Candidatus Micrarchaeota archaeon]|nr:transposase [Candidatus Micrarchaeota archaeon]